jgi:hypothetical protein
LPPEQLKEAFEAGGYRIIDQDQYNWVLAKGDTDEPIVLPKRGKLVAIEIMEDAVERARGTPLFREIVTRVHSSVANLPDGE